MTSVAIKKISLLFGFTRQIKPAKARTPSILLDGIKPSSHALTTDMQAGKGYYRKYEDKQDLHTDANGV